VNFVSVRCHSQLNDSQHYSNVDYKLALRWSGCYVTLRYVSHEFIYLFINIPPFSFLNMYIDVVDIFSKYVGKVASYCDYSV